MFRLLKGVQYVLCALWTFEAYMDQLCKEMKRCATMLAYTFHFQPSELNRFTKDDMDDWSEQTAYLNKQIERQRKRR